MNEQNQSNENNNVEAQSTKAMGYRTGAGIDPQLANGRIVRINSVTIFADARNSTGGQIPAGSVKVYYNHPDTGSEYFITGYPVASFFVAPGKLTEFERELNVDVVLPTVDKEITIEVEWRSGKTLLGGARCYCNEEV